ncbi:MAG: hypothetical protein SGPRY_003055 [Prymnesium sp.]
MATPSMPAVSPYSDLEGPGGKRAVSSYDAIVRAGFIRKVYAILTIQLLVTSGTGALFMLHHDVRNFVTHTPSLLYTALFLPIAFIIALHCYKDKHPHNMYILGGFTICEAYTVGVICAMYQESGMGMIVLQACFSPASRTALMLTAAIFISLTAYTLNTKTDFSFLGAGLFAGLVVLIVWGLLNMFFDFGIGGRMVFSLIGALLFAGFILYDTSQILTNLGPDDYVIGAINLYLDIINLFLYLLEFLRMLQGGSD